MNIHYTDRLRALLKVIGLDSKAVLMRGDSSQKTIDTIDILSIFLSTEIGKREINIVLQKHGLTSNGKYFTFAEISKNLDISRERVHQLHERTIRRLQKAMTKTGEVTHVKITRMIDKNVSILDQSIESLGINTRAYTRLKMVNISTIRDLIEKSAVELWAIRGMGDTTVKHIQDRLKTKSLSLKK